MPDLNNALSESEEPPSERIREISRDLSTQNGRFDVSYARADTAQAEENGFFQWLKAVMKGKSDTRLREAIEEYIEAEDGEHSFRPSVSSHEKTLISNVLKLRDTTVFDVMIPRADIVAIDIDTPGNSLLSLFAEKQFSRLPVYQGTLDDVLGTIHIKDVLGVLAKGQPIVLSELIREVPIVSPSLHVLDLLLQMRQSRKHMVMVVDEFGGIDGLITIGDLLEVIVGQIGDEHDPDQQPELVIHSDGTIVADARVDLDEFEERFGFVLNEDEREDCDTLGGLVSSIAGRVPVRGEVITHDTGMTFEILDADPRRVSRLRIDNIPAEASAG